MTDSLTLEEYQKLKKESEKLRRQADRVSVLLEEVTKQLNKEFGCETPEHAGKLLAKMRKEHEKFTKELVRSLEDFKAKWGEKLEGIS